ncbi:MAG: pentapeptide repeat-containing protein [Desertifilum sp.]|nr:pentapeptide repeat-containing protein [Desertifilum sp.]MDI9634950.1 pentapeptide repeat-containing protein [Geitlerinema splendidum]
MMKVNVLAAIASLSFAPSLFLPGLVAPAFAENVEHVRQLLSTKECSGCDLTNAGLRLANLTRADLRGADLSGVNLDQADLTGADLSGANLTGAVLFRTNLTGVNLTGANLTGANLNGAYLAHANLSGANLSYANLMGAFLGNANIAGALFLDTANLQGVQGLPTGVLQPEDYYRIGYENARVGNHAAAMDQYNQALKLNPTFAAAYLGRGVTRLQLGDTNGAIEDWTRAETLFTNQGNENGAQISQQFMKATQERLRASRRRSGGSFVSLMNSLVPLLLQFLVF